MKVFMPVPNEDWICDVIIKEYKARSRHAFVDDIHKADVVWYYAKWIANHFPNVRVRQEGHKPTITTVHHIVPGKKFETSFYESITDAYHVPNDITRDMLISESVTRPIIKLPYWINDSKFQPHERQPEDRQFVIGSFQRDTEGSDLISPKLEKGPDIFLEIMRRLGRDSGCRVLLGGWRRQYVIQGLNSEEISIPHDYYEKHPDVSELYRGCDYYLVTSRYEGGPQAILEASQMKVKVLSTPVGMAPEVLDPRCICRTIDDFVTAIKRDRIDLYLDETVEQNFKNAQSYLIDRLVPRYDDLVDSIHARVHQQKAR